MKIQIRNINLFIYIYITLLSLGCFCLVEQYIAFFGIRRDANDI